MQNDTRTSPSSALALLPGLQDPVEGAQETFRAALQALAHPGRIFDVDADCGIPQGLSSAMTALLLTLIDGDTPLWLPPGIDPPVRQFLRFHCGCPLVDQVADARYLAIPAGMAAPSLDACQQGDPAYPDQSATLILEVASLREGEALKLAGPGIATTQALSITGAPPDFWAQWRANHRHFPLGVDVLFTCDQQLCGLPRTTHVEQ